MIFRFLAEALITRKWRLKQFILLGNNAIREKKEVFFCNRVSLKIINF